MASSTPPPLPPDPLPYRPAGVHDHAPHSKDDLQTVADTVGFVPSMRKSDNLMQAWGALAGGGVGAVTGIAIYLLTVRGPHTVSGAAVAAVLGGIAGGVAAVFLTGVYLAIRNLFRAGKR